MRLAAFLAACAAYAAASSGGWVWVRRSIGASGASGYELVSLSGVRGKRELPASGPLSPDGGAVAETVSSKGKLEVRVVELSAPSKPRVVYRLEFKPAPAKLAPYVSALSWSPDGRRLLIEARDSLRDDQYERAVVERGGRKLFSERLGSFADTPDWSPDGATLAAIEQRRRLVIVDPAGGKRRELLDLGESAASIQRPSWSPDGRRIALFRVEPQAEGPALFTLDAVAVDSGQSASLAAELNYAAEPSWSPDSKWLAFVDPFRSLQRVDASSGAVETLVKAGSLWTLKGRQFATVRAARWSLDGKKIAFLSELYDGRSESSPPEKTALFVYEVNSKKTRKLLDSPPSGSFELRPQGP